MYIQLKDTVKNMLIERQIEFQGPRKAKGITWTDRLTDKQTNSKQPERKMDWTSRKGTYACCLVDRQAGG